MDKPISLLAIENTAQFRTRFPSKAIGPLQADTYHRLYRLHFEENYDVFTMTSSGRMRMGQFLKEKV